MPQIKISENKLLSEKHIKYAFFENFKKSNLTIKYPKTKTLKSHVRIP